MAGSDLALRVNVSTVLGAAVVYFATVLFPAIHNVSLSEGFDHILSNVWATCALIDYVTGLSFTLPYFWLRSPNAIVGTIVVVVCFGMGNVVSVALFVGFILFSGSSIREAILPLNHPLTAAPNTKTWGVTIFQWVISIIGLIYWVFLIYSVVKQPVSAGWTFITADTWSYVTFVDVLTGVSMVATYILVRELRSDNIIAPLLWFVALALLGNGVTVIYLLYISAGPMAGRSLDEVFLWGGEPGERVPLVKTK
ncbi:hypothetical protein LEN26_004196 [Aphanomyces euteiches]|nr:hypothetical protein AeMF1_015550 [Aphanomyces euteiches]KAH9149754.1 hypothetical protein LEN26_004196 [Aphanomyces euteiches]KAH9194597.1 hypothetical protein AeNC1_003432 [Aphanomyces euteiches]